MAIRGRDRFENLSAAGQPRAAPPVRFGDYVVPQAVAWELEPIGQSPRVRAEFEMRKGKPACTTVIVEATKRGRPVTTADLETLPGLDRKGVDAFKALAIRTFDDDDWRAGRNLSRAGEIANPPDRDVAAALRGRPDDELVAIAEVYRDNIEGAPVEALLEAFPDLSRRTLDRRIKAARDRGLLPPTTRGRKKA